MFQRSLTRPWGRRLRLRRKSPGSHTAWLPAYRPLPELDQAAVQTADDILGKGRVNKGGHNCGSTDLGDLNEVIPESRYLSTICMGTITGRITGLRTGKYMKPHLYFWLPWPAACWMTGGALAKKVKAAHKPLFASAEDYCAYVKSLKPSKFTIMDKRGEHMETPSLKRICRS